MAELKLLLLGTPSLQVNGQPVVIPRRKAWALLIYLAVTKEIHRRDTLATLLWPDYDQEEARTALTRHLSELRKISDQPFLHSSRETIALADPLWVDVDLFQQGVTGCKESDPNSLERLTAAIALYRDDFLRGFTLPDSPDFDEWQFFQTDGLRQQLAVALERVSILHHQRGNDEASIAAARRWLALDPLHEPAHRQLMHLLAVSGQRSAALHQYATCCRLLVDELQVSPDPATMALAEQIRSGALGRLVSKEPTPAVADHATATAASPPATHHAPRPDLTTLLSRLEPLTEQKLFGIEDAYQTVAASLAVDDRPWLIAIDGIGGIGKTTLANNLTREVLMQGRFDAVAWVSAKQEEFLPGFGVRATNRPALDGERLTDALLTQLTDTPSLTLPNREKQARLQQQLKAVPTLIVVDNLETAVDYQALLPFLRQLTNPSKVLLTSRLSLQAYSDVFCYSLSELTETDTLAFLRYEAAMRGIVPLQQASLAQLQQIYGVVGGNPLALKLVMGQVRFLPLAQVLASLQLAEGRQVDELYTYIYWQIWQMLDEPDRRLMLTLPVMPNSTFDQLAAISELDRATLQSALLRLIDHSLVQVAGDLDAPRYRLHRLTETFLLHEVLTWQPPSN